MPEFKVTFPTPVMYLMGHFKEREVLDLVVHAPNAQAALFHAIRVTNGDPGSMQVVELYTDVGPPPAIEVNPDPCPLCGVEKGPEHICLDKVL